MTTLFRLRTVLQLAGVLLLVAICTQRVEPSNAGDEKPDPKLDPTFGSVKLKAGFEPDPYVKDVVAGGSIKTDLAGVTAYIDKAPDFRLTYEAGEFVLTIRTEAKEDTTLHILTPDGKWIADDDGGGFPNARIQFKKPQSGVYNIYVGTFGKEAAKAKLIITELKN